MDFFSGAARRLRSDVFADFFRGEASSSVSTFLHLHECRPRQEPGRGDLQGEKKQKQNKKKKHKANQKVSSGLSTAGHFSEGRLSSGCRASNAGPESSAQNGRLGPISPVTLFIFKFLRLSKRRIQADVLFTRARKLRLYAFCPLVHGE